MSTVPLSFTTNQKIVDGGWDSRDAALRQVSFIRGAGFGENGPTVVLFDDFRAGSEVLPIGRQATIGRWKNPIRFGEGVPMLQWDDDGFNSRWFALRDPSLVQLPEQNRCGLYYEFSEPLTEFRVGLRSWSPTGFNFPGATEPQTLPVPSSCKPLWLAQAGSSHISGTEFPNANLVLNTHAGGGSWAVAGNDTNPHWEDTAGAIRRLGHKNSFTVPTLTTYYQSGIEAPVDPTPFDQTIDFWALNDIRQDRLGSATACAINQPAVSARSYGAMTLGAWAGNQPGGDFTNVQLYLSDVYLAVGGNSRACVILSNADSIELSTVYRLVPPAAWSDTEIRLEVDITGLEFAHVITASGLLIEGMSVEVMNAG